MDFLFDRYSYKRISQINFKNESYKKFFTHLILNYSYRALSVQNLVRLSWYDSLEYILTLIKIKKSSQRDIISVYDTFIKRTLIYIRDHEDNDKHKLIFEIKNLMEIFDLYKNNKTKELVLASAIKTFLSFKNLLVIFANLLGMKIYEKLEDNTLSFQDDMNKILINSWVDTSSKIYSIKTIRDKLSMLANNGDFNVLNQILNNILLMEDNSMERVFNFYLELDGYIDSKFFEKNFKKGSFGHKVYINKPETVISEIEKSKYESHNHEKIINELETKKCHYLTTKIKAIDVPTASKLAFEEFLLYIGAIGLSGVFSRPFGRNYIISENRKQTPDSVSFRKFPRDISPYSSDLWFNNFYKYFSHINSDSEYISGNFRKLYNSVISRFRRNTGDYESDFIDNYITLELIASSLGTQITNAERFNEVISEIFLLSSDRINLDAVRAATEKSVFLDLNDNYESEKHKNILKNITFYEEVKRNEIEIFVKYITTTRNRTVHSGKKEIEYSLLNRFCLFVIKTFLDVSNIISMEQNVRIDNLTIYTRIINQKNHVKTKKTDLITKN